MVRARLDGARRRATALAFGLAAALLIGGCDDDGSDPPRALVDSTGSPSDGPEAAVVASYDAWLAALAAHDAAGACVHHAPELTIELRYRAILEERAELGDPCVGFVAVLWEDRTTEYDPVGVEVTQLADEDALLAVDFPGVDQTVRMVYHRAKWRIADTSPRAEGAGGGSAPGDTDRWLDAWCDLDPDMSQEQIVGLMGAPSGEYTVADGGEPQLWWAQDQYDFRVYLDVDGSVLELIGDYDALSAADRALLPCPELRR